jgi:dihydroceramidase
VGRFRDLLIGVVATVVAGLIVLWVGETGGPDECIALGDCYCETIGTGRIAQPANAWSNAAFAVAGLAVLADARRRGSSPMAVDPLYPRLYGALAIFIGVGSFAFHGTMRAWGGAVDLISMYAYVGFFIAYDLGRIGRWERGRFLTALVVLTATPSVALVAIPPESGKWVFAGLVGVALLAEASVSIPALRPWSERTIDPVRRPWFWTGLAAFAAAFAVWNLSRTGGHWCAPASLLQGHAVWHLLGGMAVWCFYRYFLAERSTASSS